MIITFLGTGSAFNHKHGNTSAYLEFDDTNLLIDCGHTTPGDFEEHIGDLSILENIWISHLHADHIGGLEEIGFRFFHEYDKMINLFINQKLIFKLEQYLNVTMGDDGKNFFTYFNVIPIFKDEESFEVGTEKFETIQTEHIKGKDSFALKGDRFIYTADSKFIDWTEKDLSEIDWIFQEVQLTKEKEFNYELVHTALTELVKLKEDIKEKIFLIHYGEDILEYKDFIVDNGLYVVKPGQTWIVKIRDN